MLNMHACMDAACSLAVHWLPAIKLASTRTLRWTLSMLFCVQLQFVPLAHLVMQSHNTTTTRIAASLQNLTLLWLMCNCSTGKYTTPKFDEHDPRSKVVCKEFDPRYLFPDQRPWRRTQPDPLTPSFLLLQSELCPPAWPR